MSDASNPSHHHHHHHHGGGNKDLVQLKAIAVSEGAKLFVSVVDDQNSQGTIGTHTNKETLTFFGDYDTEAEKNLTDVEKAECEHDIALSEINFLTFSNSGKETRGQWSPCVPTTWVRGWRFLQVQGDESREPYQAR